ncbi:hypothetical protein MTP99_005815 [Tenebrio molitor]|nr:hypothetical protein MTP99_005815 [Tenebrio molitor]
MDRWPHGCRRKYSEVAVPMLVGSNPTEGGGFFGEENPPPRPAMDVCVCLSGADGRVVEGRINTLSATTAMSARVRVPSGRVPMGVINVVVYVCECEVEWAG